MFGLLIACALTKQKSAWEASCRLQPAIPVAACAVEEHRRAMGYPRLYQWFRNTIIRTEQTPECRFEAGVEWQILWLCNSCLVCGRKKIDELGVLPKQIINCDKADWRGKEKSRQKAVTVKGHHSYQHFVISSGHLAAHIFFVPT